jgi:hypothetical protein
VICMVLAKQLHLSFIIAKVSRAIASKLPTFVKWPNQLQHIKEAFYNMAGFPGVVGCLDCTHIRIKNPHGDQTLIPGVELVYET